LAVFSRGASIYSGVYHEDVDVDVDVDVDIDIDVRVERNEK
jgi:hypothetical protein